VYSGKDEYGIYIGYGVDVKTMKSAMDKLAGVGTWAPFPAKKIDPRYQWGIALQDWPKDSVLQLVSKLRQELGVLIEPFWD